MKNAPFLSSLKDNLPVIFTREEAAKQLGGLLCAKTLANFDARGLGPKLKQRIGKKVVYEREDFLAWLESRFNSCSNFNQ